MVTASIHRSSALLLSTSCAALLISCTTLLTSCTITPGIPAPSRSGKRDRELAERGAFAASDSSDGFVVPRAEAVTDGPTVRRATDTPAAPPPPTPLGLMHATLGAWPPYSPPPDLARAATSHRGSAGKTWRLERTIQVGEGYLYKAQFTADARAVVTLSLDSGTVYRYDAARGNELNRVALPEFTRFEPADFTVLEEIQERPQLIVNRVNGASILDLTDAHFDALEQFPGGDGVSSTTVFGLYATSLRRVEAQGPRPAQTGELALYWVNGQLALSAACDERPDDYSLSQDGKWLAVTYYPSNTVQVVDLEKRELLLTHPMPTWGGSVALSPDKSILAIGGDHLELVRVADGAKLAEDRNFKNNIAEIQFTRSGDLLLVSAFDGRVRSYVLPADLAQLKRLPAPQLLQHKYMSNVYGFDLDPTETRLVTPSGDKTLKVWAR